MIAIISCALRVFRVIPSPSHLLLLRTTELIVNEKKGVYSWSGEGVLILQCGCCAMWEKRVGRGLELRRSRHMPAGSLLHWIGEDVDQSNERHLFFI